MNGNTPKRDHRDRGPCLLPMSKGARVHQTDPNAQIERKELPTSGNILEALNTNGSDGDVGMQIIRSA